MIFIIYHCVSVTHIIFLDKNHNDIIYNISVIHWIILIYLCIPYYDDNILFKKQLLHWYDIIIII